MQIYSSRTNLCLESQIPLLALLTPLQSSLQCGCKLVIGYMSSHARRKVRVFPRFGLLHDFSRLESVVIFPRFSPVTCLSCLLLVSGCMILIGSLLTCACHRRTNGFLRLFNGCIFPALSIRLRYSSVYLHAL